MIVYKVNTKHCKIMNIIPFSPSNPIPKYIRPCVKCKHFQQQSKTCVLYGHVNVITGDVSFSPVDVIRESYCKGRYFVDPDGEDIDDVTDPRSRQVPDSDSESQ